RVNNRGEYVDDLFQVGCSGLMKSIDNFDLSHNVRFSTYAVQMILCEIRRYLSDNNPIRVSRSLRDTAYNALKIRVKLMTKTFIKQSPIEIMEEMGVSYTDIVFAMDAIQDPVSLFESIYNEGGDPIYIMDQISDSKEKVDVWADKLSIKEGMHRLNEREKLI